MFSAKDFFSGILSKADGIPIRPLPCARFDDLLISRGTDSICAVSLSVSQLTPFGIFLSVRQLSPWLQTFICANIRASTRFAHDQTGM